MNRLIILTILLITVNCAGVKVRTASSPGFEAKNYRSFCWIDGCEQRYEGPSYALSVEEMLVIRELIGQELEAKHYVNDENAPDLLVGFHVVINEQQQLLTDSPDMSDPYEYPVSYWDEYSNYYQRDKVFKYLKGSLVIDVVDAASGIIVWQSTTQRYMKINLDVNKLAISKSIEKAMSDFPSQKPTIPKADVQNVDLTSQRN